MNNNQANINIDKLRSSLETISSINSCLNSVDLKNYFIEVENIIKKINFEHANCIVEYKEYLNKIYEKIDELKENINSLQNGLTTTINSFSTVENRTTNKANNLVNATTEVTRIPPVSEQNQTVNETVTEKEPINTVPIGLGIGATGIAASIGAVVWDSMKDKKKIKIKEYKPEREVEKPNPQVEQVSPKVEPVFENEGPYHAARNNITKNKFYGSKITDYYEPEDNDETPLDK